VKGSGQILVNKQHVLLRIYIYIYICVMCVISN